MKFSTATIFAAGVLRAHALVGIGAPLCMAACLPLMINPIAYTACAAGCSAAAVPEGEEVKRSPRFLDDGTVTFEQESAQCTDACRPLNGDAMAYSSCLAGCAAIERKK